MRATRVVRRLTMAAMAVTVAGGALALPASASARPSHPAVMAALGDSYSSGEGNPPYDPAAEDCHRSATAWPLLAAAELRWRVTNLACSGAKTTAVVGSFKGQLAQAEALAELRPRPRVVTITIGGNDAGFANVIGACFTMGIDCASAGIVAAAEARIRTVLPGLLADAYRAVEAAAPRAQLVVVGYPRLLPAEQSAVTRCGSLLTDDERRALNEAADLLNGVIAEEARLAGAVYVDVSGTLAGHELCTSDSWLVPLTEPGGAHPNLEGQTAIADRVAEVVGRALHGAGRFRLHS